MSNQFHKILDEHDILFEIYNKDRELIYKIENPIEKYIKTHDDMFDIFICFKNDEANISAFNLLKK